MSEQSLNKHEATVFNEAESVDFAFIESFCDAGAYPVDVFALSDAVINGLSPEQLHFYHAALIAHADITHFAPELSRLRKRVEELEQVFDTRWEADMRAIKRWQEATGESNTWPDHADLCVWLMEQIEATA